MNTTRQLPPDTKKGFTEWQKWIETEASKQIVTLTAADIIHSHFPKANKINK